MTTDQDIGEICLQTIASIWQVDAAEFEQVDGGFNWSPGNHLVRVRAIPNKDSALEDRWRISVTTDFLVSVPIENESFISRTAALSSSITSTYSMSYPPVELWKDSKDRKPKLSLFSSIYVSPELCSGYRIFLLERQLFKLVMPRTNLFK